MKKFSDFPRLKNYMNLDEHSKFDKEHYIGNRTLNLIENVWESSFEDFIKRNNYTIKSNRKIKRNKISSNIKSKS